MRTLIWLGTDEFIPDLDEPDQHRKPVQLSNGFSLLDRLSRSKYNHLDFSYYDFLDSVCLSRIMCLPWWTRVWVVQEAVVSPAAVFLLGSSELPWQAAITGATNFTSHFTGCCRPGTRPEERKFDVNIEAVHRLLNFTSGILLSFRYFQTNHSNELLSRLWMMRSKTATDPRDKIYATLGLLRSKKSTMLKPNYTMDTAALYRLVVLDNIICSGRLDIFMGSRSMDHTPLPSWAIDWTEPSNKGEEKGQILSEMSKQVYTASLDRKPDFVHHPRTDQLQVFGILEDIVYRIGDIGEGGYDFHNRIHQMEMLNSWKELIESSTKSGSPYAASSSKDIFWRTTLGDVFLAEGERLSAYNVGDEQGESSIRRIGDDDRPIWEHWWAWRNGRIELEDTPPGIEVPEVRNIGSSVTRASTGRRLFVTRRGYIGLCPSSGRVGDVVAVLLGGSTPFILSARSKRERALEEANSELQVQNTFVLIGDCYVHGLMDGEALRGEETDDALGVEDIFLE